MSQSRPPRARSGAPSLPLLLLLLSISLSGLLLQCSAQEVELIETIKLKPDPNLSEQVEHEEYAFRAPMRGVPEHVLRLYCANVKLRLYWNVFREQVKEELRKGLYLRRMARFTRHIFEGVRDVDKPFDAPMLSVIDEYYGVTKAEAEDDAAISNVISNAQDATGQDDTTKTLKKTKSFTRGKLKALKEKFMNIGKSDGEEAQQQQQTTTSQLEAADVSTSVESVESSDSYQSLEKKGFKASLDKIKSFVVEWAPKIGLGIYTRWRTMWWMMMSCLYTKYYLWDPALDEFIKLKRALIMYPDIQTVKLQDIDCKPVKFFQRILDVCKILNPLMNFSFGQLSLDKMTRFKGGLV